MTSTTDTEYIAMAKAVKDALSVRNVLGFGVPSREASCTTVYEDNDGIISMASKPPSSARSRCTDVRYHILHEKVDSGDTKHGRLHRDH